MEQLIEFFRRAEGDMWMKCDGTAPALVGEGWRKAQTDEQYANYFGTEFRLLKEQIDRKGFGSIFLMGQKGSWAVHFRVVVQRGGFQVHRLD